MRFRVTPSVHNSMHCGFVKWPCNYPYRVIRGADTAVALCNISTYKTVNRIMPNIIWKLPPNDRSVCTYGVRISSAFNFYRYARHEIVKIVSKQPRKSLLWGFWTMQSIVIRHGSRVWTSNGMNWTFRTVRLQRGRYGDQQKTNRPTRQRKIRAVWEIVNCIARKNRLI